MKLPIPDSFNLTDARRLLLPVAAFLLMFAGGLWWLLHTDYVAVELPAGGSARQEALATLQGADIPYREGKEGRIEVPAGSLSAARTLLQATGHAFPEPAGYELIDRDDYTLSEFTQRLNYQRALEGELARTLTGLREVRSARVHLTIPKRELFSAKKPESKASIVLQLRDGQVLSPAGAAGIRELVAASVDGLSPENIAILDDRGMPLVSGTDGRGLDARIEQARHIEEDLEQRVRRLLESTWGIRDPYVSVRADLNFDRVTSVRDGAVPGDDAVGMLTRELTSDATPSRDSGTATSTATREYAYARERVETEYASGRVARLSIAVALPAGYASMDPAAMESTIGAAIGLHAERGDTLVVSVTPALAPLVAIGNPAPGTAAAPGRAASASAGAAAAKSAATSPASATATKADGGFSHATTLLLLALAVVAAAALYFALRPARHAAPARLDKAERERLLSDLRRWLDGATP